LPPIHWPDPWPTDYLIAMRAATFAFTVGCGREFTMQAFRDAFQKGRELSIAAHVLDAGVQSGIKRSELEHAIAAPEIKRALRQATHSAHELGVFGVPTIAVGDELFWGDDRLEDAAVHLQAVSAA